MGIPLVGSIIKLIGSLLGLAKKFNIAGKVQDLILKAEAMRNKTGPEKLAYVLNQITSNAQIKNWLEKLKSKAIKAGLDGGAIYDKAYDSLEAQIKANVAALNALGLLLPHTTKPIASTAYAVTVKPAIVEKLTG